jgi:hypothetical protein
MSMSLVIDPDRYQNMINDLSYKKLKDDCVHQNNDNTNYSDVIVIF